MKKWISSSLVLMWVIGIIGCAKTVTYTVTLDSGNGTENTVVQLEPGKRVTLPADPVFEGHNFMGWYVGETMFDFNTKVEQNYYITAKWAEVTFTIHFVTNGGSSIMNQTVAYGDKVTKPTDPILQYYTFDYWELNDVAFDFNTPITSNLFLYAVYNHVYYTVFFETDGGTSISSIEVPGGTQVAIPTQPTKQGFAFQGWYIGDTPYDFSNLITSNTIIYAKWDVSQFSMPYYNGIEGLTGNNLIIFLNALLEQMTKYDYGSARYVLDDFDRDPNNSSNLIDFYTGNSLPGVWDLGITWNREHVWPQSLLGEGTLTNTSINSATDYHNLKPSNQSSNSSRSNKWFGTVTNTNSYLPIADIRGDIARILFYMDIRYDALSLVNLTGTQDPAIHQMGDLATLLLWHIEDPVDDFERNRNNLIYNYQHNRNPFIDYPELVSYIYNN